MSFGGYKGYRPWSIKPTKDGDPPRYDFSGWTRRGRVRCWQLGWLDGRVDVCDVADLLRRNDAQARFQLAQALEVSRSEEYVVVGMIPPLPYRFYASQEQMNPDLWSLQKRAWKYFGEYGVMLFCETLDLMSLGVRFRLHKSFLGLATKLPKKDAARDYTGPSALTWVSLL